MWLYHKRMPNHPKNTKQLPLENIFYMGVKTRWFNAIKNGKKTVEGRLKKKFGHIKKGTTLVIRKNPESTNSKNNSQNDTHVLIVVVTDNVKYRSFEEYLLQEGLARTLPGVRSIEEGVNIYRSFYSEEDEKTHGVSAIHIRLVA